MAVQFFPSDGSKAIGYSYTVGIGFSALAKTNPTDATTVVGISADGSRICAYAVDQFNEYSPGVYVAGNGLTVLPTIAGLNQTIVTGISADGHTIVGYATDGASNNHALVWTDATAAVNAGPRSSIIQ
jgi:probable HAF family extracellular repeat protein